jgi:hyperpolarization activated cyclic nucleotide-gated potassium channel 2
MVVMLALTVISVPVAISFFRDGVGLPWFVISCFVDAIFLFDIVLNFFTGVVADNGTSSETHTCDKGR